MATRGKFANRFGPYSLTPNQVRVLMVMKKATEEPKPRHITAAEVSGCKMPTFYRLRHLQLARSRMTPGGRFEPRHGLIWTITETGRAYLATLIEQLGRKTEDEEAS